MSGPLLIPASPGLRAVYAVEEEGGAVSRDDLAIVGFACRGAEDRTLVAYVLDQQRGAVEAAALCTKAPATAAPLVALAGYLEPRRDSLSRWEDAAALIGKVRLIAKRLNGEALTAELQREGLADEEGRLVLR